MRPAQVIEITTPKKIVLHGLWFGPKRPRAAIVWIHGLSSSAFSRLDIVEKLLDTNTAVMTFNNRGSGTVNRVSKGKRSLTAGGGAEIFTDCVDDIDGAVRYAKRAGVKEIYLAGHSTGCQKAVYWASKARGANRRGIKGIILLAPLSDWAGEVRTKRGHERVARATKAAQALVRARKPQVFLPDALWTYPITAQRFLSLYSPDSVEQSIFSYFDERQAARIFKSVTLPTLVLLAEQDEYADRPAHKIVDWFRKYNRSSCYADSIVSGVGHSFREAEVRVAQQIKHFI